MKQLLWGAAAAIMLAATPALAGTTVVSNTTPISVVDNGQTTSSIVVSGVGGDITSVTLSLFGLSHTYPDDLVIGLVNEDAKVAMMLFSGVGGSTGVSNIDLTFDDEAATDLPRSNPAEGSLVSGTFLPSNFNSYSLKNYLSLGPSFRDIANFNGFNGLGANGTWKLYVLDTYPGDVGALSGGFSLTFNTTDVGGGGPGGVPEPATWAMMIMGLGGVGAVARRRRLVLA